MTLKSEGGSERGLGWEGFTMSPPFYDLPENTTVINPSYPPLPLLSLLTDNYTYKTWSDTRRSLSVRGRDTDTCDGSSREPCNIYKSFTNYFLIYFLFHLMVCDLVLRHNTSEGPRDGTESRSSSTTVGPSLRTGSGV